MRALLALILALAPALAWCWTAPEAPAISRWDDSPGVASGPAEVPRSQFTTVRIDTMAAYVRYLFMMKQAVILPEFDDFRFFFAYNDGYSHVRTKVFTEAQLHDQGQWSVTDVYEWTGDGTLRYICPTAYWDGFVWYPQVTISTGPPTANWHFIDEGSVSGISLWSPPMHVLGPYSCCPPLTEAGPGNVVHMLSGSGEAAGGYPFKAFSGWDATPLHDALVFADTEVFGQGYENSQLLYHGGLLAAAVGGYRTANLTSDPLLVVYETSTDGGQTWSEAVWLDQAVVPDMPGTLPGIEGHWSNSFFDGLIDDDGDLHFICAVVDSGCFDNTSYVHGLYDVHQEDGVWTASVITDGTDYRDSGDTWNPRSLLDGDTYLHAPSLAWHPAGIIFATWADIGYIDPGDSSFTFDVWYSWSADEGNTWHTPHRVTDTPEWNESFPRLLPTTTDDYAYVLTMYEWADGPMDMIQFLPIYGAPDPAGTTPTIAKLSVTPNPLADAVRVSFSLASPEMVEAGVYTARGELVETPVRGSMPAGSHSLVWNANDASPGVYLARVNAGEETASARMVLVR
jgi:hypothetical protein